MASAYRAALEATAGVIQRRARSFRNLVVAVVLIGAASVASALVAGSPLGLVGLLFIVPACGVFFVVDSALLAAWRSSLLGSWSQGDLDLNAFRAAVVANRALPEGTTGAMLATLPSAGELVSEQRILTPTRAAVAAHCRAVHRGRAEVLVLAAVASAIVVGAVASALWARSWRPLLALGALVLSPLVSLVLGRQRRAARDATVAACRGEVGFDEEAYQRLLTTLR